MLTLVDTSVWIAHFKKKDLKLTALLENAKVVTHPYILGELYLGKPNNKNEVIQYIELLPRLDVLDISEMKIFIEEFSLNHKGLGLVDVGLLAAAFKEGVSIYSLDKKLQSLSEKLIKQ